MTVKQKSGFYERFIAQAQDRRTKALKLRKAGSTFEQIGAELGISRQRAFDLVQREKRDVDA